MKRFLSVFAVLAVLAGCAGSNDGLGGVMLDANGNPIPFGTPADFVARAQDRVFFALDSSTLTTEATAALDFQAKWLAKYDETKAVVAGHCDERGTREYNLALGERRAQAVKDYLVSKGVDATRLDTISYGKERPAVMGSNEAAWAQNRRGVTTIK